MVGVGQCSNFPNNPSNNQKRIHLFILNSCSQKRQLVKLLGCFFNRGSPTLLGLGTLLCVMLDGWRKGMTATFLCAPAACEIGGRFFDGPLLSYKLTHTHINTHTHTHTRAPNGTNEGRNLSSFPITPLPVTIHQSKAWPVRGQTGREGYTDEL